MKILLCIDNLGRGGRERRIVELIKGLLAKNSLTLSLVIFSDKVDYPEIFDMDIRVHLLPRKPKKDPRIFYKFFKICKQVKPDLIHSWGDMATIYAIPAAQFLTIRLYNGSVADAPHMPNWSNTEFVRKRITSPFSYKIIGNSEEGLKQYKIPPQKAVCIPNGFDFNRTKNLTPPKEIRDELGIKSTCTVGMIGAFHPRKDYAMYLSMAKQVIDKGFDVSFLAIGEGISRRHFMDQVEEKYQGKIIFTGLRTDVESIIGALDIGVLATNPDVHGEGISNAILEFMALGKPVVATEGGGTSEIIDDLRTGFLVQPKSPECMAEKVIHLLIHPILAQQMGQRGKERIINSFNLNDMTDAYLNLYRSA